MTDIPRLVTPRDDPRPFGMSANAVQYRHPVRRSMLSWLAWWAR